MIALSVVLLSALWSYAVFGYIPIASGVEDSVRDWLAIGIDSLTFLVALVAVRLACHRKYSWMLALVFLSAPVVHVIGYFVVGEIKILFLVLPIYVVVGAVIAHYLTKLLRRSSRVT
jgi:hypothetical protein